MVNANIQWLVNKEGLTTVPHHIPTPARLTELYWAIGYHQGAIPSFRVLPDSYHNTEETAEIGGQKEGRTAWLKSGSTPKQQPVVSNFLNFLSITFCHLSNSQ